MKFRHQPSVVLLAALLFVACAAKTKPLEVAAQATHSVTVMLKLASDTLDDQYARGGIPGSVVNEVRAALLPVAQATQSAVAVLLIWTDVDTAPPEMAALLTALSQSVERIAAALPSGTPGRGAILAHLSSATAVVRAIANLFVGHQAEAIVTARQMLAEAP
ncbi:MAG: hypothetical protein NUV51_04575 [Sulfuricaulis sp.]|nr:hypothetical protein [Sulfuricaulis sp.]